MATLYYVIGPSGVGKDSVMGYARERLLPEHRCVFAHRYITRSADAGGENHVALSALEFQTRQDADFFALSWDSHGYRYGIGCEVRRWLDSGFNVVVNGSRGYLPEATRRFPELSPILITVQAGALRRRLEARGRESADEIEKRIQRATSISVDHPRLISLSNDGPLEQAGEEMLEIISARQEATL